MKTFFKNRHNKEIIYITGNQKKAEYFASYIGHPISHLKVDLDEIQSLDLKKIVEHKVRQAYNEVKKARGGGRYFSGIQSIQRLARTFC